MNGYELSRGWFDFSFENPDKIRPIHAAIYFFAIEHCNRLGWKEKFGLPSQMVMEAIGVKNWRTYSKGLSDLVDFGFIKMIEVSKNQYSSNIIAIVNFTKANTKPLDKALQKHGAKHGQSTVSIDKQDNNEQETKELSPFESHMLEHSDTLSKVQPQKKNLLVKWLTVLYERDPTKIDRFTLPLLVEKFNSENLKTLTVQVDRSIAGGYKKLFETEEEKQDKKPKVTWG